MHLNVTVSPSVTVFCEALVVSLAPSGLSNYVVTGRAILNPLLTKMSNL